MEEKYKRLAAIKVSVKKGTDYRFFINIGDNPYDASNVSGSSISATMFSRYSDHSFPLTIESSQDELAIGKLELRVNANDTVLADEAEYYCDVIEINQSGEKYVLASIVMDMLRKNATV